jgi:hypothetical protein
LRDLRATINAIDAESATWPLREVDQVVARTPSNGLTDDE